MTNVEREIAELITRQEIVVEAINSLYKVNEILQDHIDAEDYLTDCWYAYDRIRNIITALENLDLCQPATPTGEQSHDK